MICHQPAIRIYQQRAVRCALLLCIVAVWHAAAELHAGQIDQDKAVKVKAAFVLNFIRFTQWPAHKFDSDEAPLRVHVIGSGALSDTLQPLLSRATVHERSVVVRVVDWPALRDEAEQAEAEQRLIAEMRQGHVTVVTRMRGSDVRTLMQGLQGSAVLTVGDVPEFASRGGMLGFVIRDKRVAFQANKRAIEASELSVSSKVLRLAEIIENTTGGLP